MVHNVNREVKTILRHQPPISKTRINAMETTHQSKDDPYDRYFSTNIVYLVTVERRAAETGEDRAGYE